MEAPRPSRRKFLKQAAFAASTAAVLPRGSLVAGPGDKIKIGQIGVGHAHAGGKLASYRASPDFEVVGIVEPNAEWRETAEKNKTYAGLKWMTTEELLNVPGLQAVAVETRVSGLLEAAETCARAGLHIHLDKPAGASLPRFKAILDETDRQGRTVQMGYMYRYNPAVVFLKDLLEKNWLGEVFEIHAVMSKVGNLSGRRRWADHSGGMMFELGCHLIDLAVGILGRPDKVTPYLRRVVEMDDGGLQDNTLAVFEYPKALTTIKSAGVEVSGGARRHLAVCGTYGTCHIQPLDAPSVKFVFDRPRGEYGKGYQEIVFGNYARYVEDAKDFARIIRGEKESDYKSEFDYHVQETVLRASAMPLT